MKIKTLTVIFASIIIVSTISCSKTGTEGPAGPAGPSYTGTVSGYVNLFDQYGTRILTNLAGIKVSIIGTNKTTKTDSAGYYIFNNISTGSYSYSFVDTTNNYAEEEAFNVQYIVGNVDRDVKMSQIPTFNLASCTAGDTTIAGTNYIYLLCLDSVASVRALTLAVFVSADSTVAPNASNYLVNYTETIKANKTQVLFVIPTTDLYGAGIMSGQKAYFGIYPAAADYASTSDYENLSNGMEVYNAIGAKALTCNVKAQ